MNTGRRAGVAFLVVTTLFVGSRSYAGGWRYHQPSLVVAHGELGERNVTGVLCPIRLGNQRYVLSNELTAQMLLYGNRRETISVDIGAGLAGVHECDLGGLRLEAVNPRYGLTVFSITKEHHFSSRDRPHPIVGSAVASSIETQRPLHVVRVRETGGLIGAPAMARAEVEGLTLDVFLRRSDATLLLEPEPYFNTDGQLVALGGKTSGNQFTIGTQSLLAATLANLANWSGDALLVRQPLLISASLLEAMLGKDILVELREPCFEGRSVAGSVALDRIYKHGPEYDAGLRAGDIVTHVNGQEVHSWPQLAGHYLRFEDITLVTRRGTTEIKRAFRSISLDELDRRLLAEIGLAVQPVEQTLEPAIEVAHAAGPSAAFFVPNDRFTLARHEFSFVVHLDGPASARWQLQRQDASVAAVATAIASHEVTSPSDLIAALGIRPLRRPADLVVQRNGTDHVVEASALEELRRGSERFVEGSP